MIPKAKWRFAIGTTSLVPHPHSRRLHYLIVDVDGPDVTPTLIFLNQTFRRITTSVYPTPHGWHIYTNYALPWASLCVLLSRIPGVDNLWVTIGRRRGYFYLADKCEVRLTWPVVRMVLHHGKKKA